MSPAAFPAPTSPQIQGHTYRAPATPADAGRGWMRLRPGQTTQIEAGQSLVVRMAPGTSHVSADVFCFEQDGTITGPLLYQKSSRHLTAKERVKMRRGRLKMACSSGACALVALLVLIF